MAKNSEVDSISDDGDCEHKTVKRSPLTSKNLNRTIGYSILKPRLAFTKLKKAFIKAPII